ncbi:kinase-like domain-containing protein [Cristinia sonorae]|uniref:Kinase-like domain-containing protein n=1 Tax=Cristinia sonorae TaxID=1940300 RepID=A0A8K0XQ85_9AGAR|nr:kinase-like domain-containing protein [Cristinia sonorae]
MLYLHSRHFIHGDLHSNNVVVDGDGSLKLTDMGHFAISDGNPSAHGVMHGGGLVHFTAPERFDPAAFACESERPTLASDVYSFACIIFEIFAGHIPFYDAHAQGLSTKVAGPADQTLSLRKCGKCSIFAAVIIANGLRLLLSI